MWDVERLTELAVLEGHTSAVRALAATDTKVFSGSDDTTIKVGDAGGQVMVELGVLVRGLWLRVWTSTVD